LELREIQSLIVLAKTRSILETAKELNLTAGAVHKHLKTLEAEFGLRLYEKFGGSLRLTEAGKMAIPYLNEMIEKRQAALEAIYDWNHSVRGVVRVGAGPSFSSYMLPAILKKFRHRYQYAEVYVETGNGDHLMNSLRSGSLDLIFDLAESALQSTDIVPIGMWEAEIGIVSGLPNLPQRSKLSRLSNIPFILFQKGSHMETLLDRYFHLIGFSANVVMRSDSAEAIKAMVKSRLGVAMLFLWNANQEFRTGSLRVIRTEAPPLTARLALMKRKTSYTSKALIAFAQVMQGMNWKNLHPVPPDDSNGSSRM
jgi:DNA-binding transcriptional LysR family regulator